MNITKVLTVCIENLFPPPFLAFLNKINALGITPSSAVIRNFATVNISQHQSQCQFLRKFARFLCLLRPFLWKISRGILLPHYHAHP